MTRRLQTRIILIFVIVLLGTMGFVAYDRLNQAPLITPEAKYIKTVAYSLSDNLAIFEIRWKDDMKASSVKDKDNYYIEQVVRKSGKWFTVMNGKKCKISFVQHVPDQLDPNKKGKVTQISAYVTPKEKVDDFFRVRVRNVETKKGEKMGQVEFGVAGISNFAKFTKK